MRRLGVALVLVGLALGLAVEWATYRPGELGMAAADLLTGWALIGCGLAAWLRRPESRVGALLAATGAAWFAGDFGTALLFVHRGPLVHALLAYPSGRVHGRWTQALVIAAYVDGAIEPLARDPAVTVVLCGAIAATALLAYRAEIGPRRRARAVGTAGAVAVAGVLGLGAAGSLAGSQLGDATLLAYEVVLAVMALGVLADLRSRRWSEGALTGLVVDLGGRWEPMTLRDSLARALGDSSLQVGYWLDSEHGFVDEAGAPFIPDASDGRVVTPIDSESRPVALLVHDGAVLDDPGLVEAVAVATRMAVANVRMRSEVRARVDELAASRRRIVVAADRQRLQLERELREGAQRRLAAVSEHVAALAQAAGAAPARKLLADVDSQLGAAQAELGRLARGIHPAALTSGGLATALAELAGLVPVEVQLEATNARFPAAIEAAAYFVCSEALANVVKHGRASRAQVDVSSDGTRVIVAVSDDGAGGADPDRGSGLRGLADRVEAFGGRLVLESPIWGGTRVCAEIPLR